MHKHRTNRTALATAPLMTFLSISACEGAPPEDAIVVGTNDQALVKQNDGVNRIFDARNPNITFCFEHKAANLTATRADFVTSMSQYGNIISNAYGGTAVNLQNRGECADPPTTDTKIVIDEDSVAGGATRFCTLAAETVDCQATGSGTVPVIFTAGQDATQQRRAELGAHEMIHVLGFRDEYGSGCATKAWDPSAILTQSETSTIAASTGYCNSNTSLTDRDKLGLEIVYGSAVDADASVGAAFRTGSGRVFRIGQPIVVDWRLRGATDTAFSGEPLWKRTGAPVGVRAREFTPSSAGTYAASFVDYGSKARQVNQFTVDSGLHTAVLMSTI